MQSMPIKTAAEVFDLPAPPKTGRGRLIATAVDLFYANGFGSVGIDLVIEAAGVTKTTFYKHFKSKNDLMVAAVKRQDEWESAAWNRTVQKVAGSDPRSQFLGVLEVLDYWFNDPRFRGCIFLNAALEFPNPNNPVHRAASEHSKRKRNSRRDLAIAAGASQSGAEEFADAYTALIEGALSLRIAQNRNDAARAIRPAIELLIKTYLPKSPC